MLLRRSPISTAIMLLMIFVAWFALDQTRFRAPDGPTQWAVIPPGKLVDVGNFRLHLYCQGETQAGLPVVILEAGAGDDSRTWSQVQPALAGETLVCAYDRAGYGWSDPGPRLRTASRMAAELHTLLDNAGILPPYILVAHSFGGFPARRFALDFPQDTAGLILVDATDETLPLFLPVTTMLAAGLQFDALWRAFDVKNGSLRQPHASQTATLSAELLALPITTRQVRVKPGGLDDLPLIVISASLDASTDRVTMSQREVMTQWSTQNQYIAVESGHALHHEQPEVVIQAIRSLLIPFQKESVPAQRQIISDVPNEP